MMVEVLGLEPAPVATAHLSERARHRPCVIEAFGRERVDELETTRALFVELAALRVRQELRRGGRPSRPGQVQDEELQYRLWYRRLYGPRWNLAEALRQRLIRMPQHLIDPHLAELARCIGTKGFDACADRVANRRIMK